MRHLRTILVAAAAVLIGVAMTAPVLGAVACDAVGEAFPIGGGQFEYRVTITWGFEGAALPDRFDIVIAQLEDCGFYDPEGRLGAAYVVPGLGGPLPDCNVWSPVETTRWGTIKALYR